jgi:hypothetical protein
MPRLRRFLLCATIRTILAIITAGLNRYRRESAIAVAPHAVDPGR